MDYLYLDANGLLHGAAQRVFSYGSGAHIIDDYAELSFEQKLIAVYELFMNKLQIVVSTITPKRLLYIAIDGTAPIAKQAQQRQRRYQAGMHSKLEIATEDAEESKKFDTSSITPGTLFMHGLVQYMNYAIRRNISQGKIGMADWSTFDVIFSPPNVPSEGEHKILNFMRSLPEIERQDRTHCMFGPDGDLIMLTLATQFPHMFLFREDAFSPGYADLLDMSGIAEGISQRISRPINESTADFVFLGFFVGNDFLPKIRMFLYLEDGLEFMLTNYRATRQPITSNNIVLLSGLSAFVSRLAEQERTYLAEQAKRPPVDEKFTNFTLLRYFKDDRLDYLGYRTAYYEKFLPAGAIESDIRELCRKYLRGLIWVFIYYMKGIPSWGEYFPERYAPLMEDMARYLSSITEEDFDALSQFAIGEPSVPFVQLLSVIPPTSANLLPDCLRPLLQRGSPLEAIVFRDFKTDYEGVTAEHMAPIDLPFAPQDIVMKAYLLYSTKCPKYARNQRGTDSLFFYDARRSGKFTSVMGEVEPLRARRCPIASIQQASGTPITMLSAMELSLDRRLRDFFLLFDVRDPPVSGMRTLVTNMKPFSPVSTVFMFVSDVGLDVLCACDAFIGATIYAYQPDEKKRCILRHNVFSLRLTSRVHVVNAVITENVDLAVLLPGVLPITNSKKNIVRDGVIITLP